MTEVQLLNGLKLSYENASQLIEEADGLFIFERYSRAYALYQLAIEEVGKALIIFQAILDKINGIEINEEYFNQRNFKHHQTKTKKVLRIQISIFEIMSEKSSSLKNILKELREKYSNSRLLNDRKNQSLYVGIEGERFNSPQDAITKELTKEFSSFAKLCLLGIKSIVDYPFDAIEEISNRLQDKMTKDKNEFDK